MWENIYIFEQSAIKLYLNTAMSPLLYADIRKIKNSKNRIDVLHVYVDIIIQIFAILNVYI